MKWPRIVLRRRDATRRRPGGLGAGYWLGGIFLFVASFVLAFYLFFPVGALKERLEEEVAANTPLTLTIDRLQLLFPPGLKARGIILDFGVPERPPERVQSLTATPLWGGLLTGDPGVEVEAALRGGHLAGELRQDGTVRLELADLSVSEPLLPASSMSLEGVLKRGRFAGRVPLQSTDEGRLELTLARVRVIGLESLGVADGTLDLGEVSLTATGKGNAWRIDTLTASGGELNATGSGTVMVAEPIGRSRLNLTFVVTPASALDPNLKDLLELFGGAPQNGSFRFRLSGTAANPVFAR